MMGGDVTVSTEYGKGSTFTIRLPAWVSKARTEPAPEPGAARSRPAPRVRGTVLVIDDDPTVRDLLRRFLEKEGFGVEAASGGEEGLRMARELRPHAITLDVMMPGMDGWAVLAALKADSDLDSIPVIMLTIIDDKSMGYALGASEYLTKPVDRERLCSVLEKYCQKEGEPRHALVVEDDRDTREMLRRLLERDGWAAAEAENGRAAIECMEARRPDLLLLDLMMPEMDGFQVVDEIRRREEWRSIPIVVITAKDITAEDRLRLSDYVRAILQKGAYEYRDLLAEIRDLMRASVG